MSYCYSPLLPGPDQIRLLRLLPHDDEHAPLQGQLFNHTIQDSGRRTHPYAALSYVWGDSVNPRSISIDEHNLHVTMNLHGALSRLRHSSIERVLWVDAVCINQKDTLEKEQQIRIMAKIYALASHVVVWLGDEAENSDQALEEIRLVGSRKNSPNPSSLKVTQQDAVLALLQRPWFRRIWVLQEVAAARHILVMCGSTEIDGYAFCLGVSSLNFHGADPELQRLIRSVTYLIEGAIFRPGYATTMLGRSSLDICPLGELIDMYQTHEATEQHDKIYALLGMSSDDLSKAGLSPNYSLPWEALFRNLIKFLLYDDISVEILGPKQTVLMKTKGCLIAKVLSVQSDIAEGDSQDFHVIFKNPSRMPRSRERLRDHWSFHVSAKSVQDGDFICLLQGVSKPLIVRLCNGHFDIVLIVATPPESLNESLQLMRTPDRNITLIWDWGKLPRESKDLAQGDLLLGTDDLESELCKIGFESHLDKATRRWNFAMTLEGFALDNIVKDEIQKAIEGYERTSTEGDEHMVKQLLETGEVDVDFKQKNGATPLWWAAKAGHDTVVKLLIRTGKVNIDAKDKHGTTPLLAAAGGGHLAIVDILLQEKADVNVAAGTYGTTALQAAAGGGHLAVVERLLQEKADVNAKAGIIDGTTALQAAARGGHLAVVERLLQEKTDVNAAVGRYGTTALQAAAREGHLAVVERLLQQKADVNAKGGIIDGTTALQAAAEGGHLAVVERLLQHKADVNAKGGIIDGTTALQVAAEGGHLAVVKRLLQEKADVNASAAGYKKRTALEAAARGGHLAIVEMLLQEKADVNAAAGYKGRTALQAAAEGGYLAVVERLLQEKADVNAAAAAGYKGRTALQAAAEGGHLTVVERLLEEKADVNAAAAAEYGRTALQAAARGGYLAVVERLLQQKAEVNAEAGIIHGTTALQAAAEGGHLAVVERLLQEKADVNAAAGTYGTALEAAVGGGHLDVVECLRNANVDT